MIITKETKIILDAIASVGNYVEIFDAEGTYIYCSENSGFDNMSPKDVIGKNFLEVSGLSKSASKLIEVLITGIPLREQVIHYTTKATGQRHLWIMNMYPLIVDGKIDGAIAIYKQFSNVKSVIDEYCGTNDLKEKYPVAVEDRHTTTFSDIIYSSGNMADVVDFCKKAAGNTMPVLIVGETGTGKELFAKSIHSQSSKKDKPFIVVNCAAIPDTLLESIMFGVTKGAYTGAIEKPGLFEQSSDGTLFLDEIQALSPEMQAKLLRVLEYKKVRRIGGNKEIDVNPRIITAMNVNPEEYIRLGKMKPDLFYRIAVLTVNIPPLRERPSDIPLLAYRFIKSACDELKQPVCSLSNEALDVLQRYSWPGNVRELRHAITQALITKEEIDESIRPEHLPEKLQSAIRHPLLEDRPRVQQHSSQTQFSADELTMGYKDAYQMALNDFNSQFNRFFLKHAMENNGYNISKTAETIQLSRQHLHKLLKKYNLK